MISLHLFCLINTRLKKIILQWNRQKEYRTKKKKKGGGGEGNPNRNRQGKDEETSAVKKCLLTKTQITNNAKLFCLLSILLSRVGVCVWGGGGGGRTALKECTHPACKRHRQKKKCLLCYMADYEHLTYHT